MHRKRMKDGEGRGENRKQGVGMYGGGHPHPSNTTLHHQ